MKRSRRWGSPGMIAVAPHDATDRSRSPVGRPR
jgi:hypothetical protein